ncbi:MAG: hypothetical protein N2049_00830 [Anaerolineales bacterium]|nr:hypothetical protein [Anaerolineales bacterium]MCX7607749.1 hypothetical protein [Anaerolineales bacterium]MDW8226322.1 hypothetical protein [Anaerolineales bacterium]
MLDLLTGIISLLLTVMILSYLLGDNPAFRLAAHIFVGVSAGYVAVIAWNQVLLPRLFRPLLVGGTLDPMLIVPLMLGVLLLAKLSPRTAALGSPALAIMVGVGAAVAVSGAIFGTLFPQVWAVIRAFDITSVRSQTGNTTGVLGEALIMLLATVSSLVYLQFGARKTPAGPQRGKLIRILASIGQVFIAMTFGVIFAGVLAAAMTAFIERLSFLINFVSQFL